MVDHPGGTHRQCACPARHVLGEVPCDRLNARLNASSAS
jgi:hypothetical protein